MEDSNLEDHTRPKLLNHHLNDNIHLRARLLLKRTKRMRKKRKKRRKAKRTNLSYSPNQYLLPNDRS
jgi:hypothetical protein